MSGTPAIRHNGSESVQADITITVEGHGAALCRLLGRAKGLAGHGRMLMVKVSILRRTRYPWHPRKGRGRFDFFWPPPKKFPAETHIQLIGTLKAVEAGCRATVSACLRDLGRAPDCISCRLGRSLATPQTQELLADPDIHAYYFGGRRWQALRVHKVQVTPTCVYLGILDHVALQPAMIHTVLKFLAGRRLRLALATKATDFVSLGSWRLGSRGGTLRLSVYAFVVHARMFNELGEPKDATAAIRQCPSLDRWSETAMALASWSNHPMVLKRGTDAS